MAEYVVARDRGSCKLRCRYWREAARDWVENEADGTRYATAADADAIARPLDRALSNAYISVGIQLAEKGGGS